MCGFAFGVARSFGWCVDLMVRAVMCEEKNFFFFVIRSRRRTERYAAHGALGARYDDDLCAAAAVVLLFFSVVLSCWCFAFIRNATQRIDVFAPYKSTAWER